MNEPTVNEPATDQQPPAPEQPVAEQPVAPEQPVAEQPVPEQPVAEEAVQAQLNETLPVALEPELRKIIDTAVARVASIELEAIRESRRLTQRSEEEGREALKFALDRAFQLVNSFELLTVTVAGMVSAMRVELDAAMAALDHADDPYSRLASPVTPAKAIDEAPQPEPEEAPAPLAAEPVADHTPDIPVTPDAEKAQGMNGDAPELHTEPSPEMTEMFREQIINMKSSGKTREEAERSLLRFNLGRRFIGLLDEIYSGDTTEVEVAPASGQRKRFARRFFSRN